MPVLAQFKTVCGSIFRKAASSSAVTMSGVPDGVDGELAMILRAWYDGRSVPLTYDAANRIESMPRKNKGDIRAQGGDFLSNDTSRNLLIFIVLWLEPAIRLELMTC